MQPVSPLGIVAAGGLLVRALLADFTAIRLTLARYLALEFRLGVVICTALHFSCRKKWSRSAGKAMPGGQ